jgi:hypothetical protein
VTDQLKKIPQKTFLTPWRSWKHALTFVLHLMDPTLNKKKKYPSILVFIALVRELLDRSVYKFLRDLWLTHARTTCVSQVIWPITVLAWLAWMRKMSYWIPAGISVVFRMWEASRFCIYVNTGRVMYLCHPLWLMSL